MDERVSFGADKWWLVANVLGAAAYVWLSSWTWLEPALRGEEVARAGDAVVWSMTALPLFVGFMVADGVWFIRRAQQGESRKPLLLAVCLWVVVLGVCRALS